ncbi:MAG: hypothetical protein O9327_17060 [Polaromonas sp.]|nr:hypothetical protein [Polaromonas sp.]
MAKFNKVQLTTNWFDERDQNVWFDLESRCVCAHFARLVREAGLTLSSGWGILGEYLRPPQPMRYELVAGLHRTLPNIDIREYASLGSADKKRYFLGLIVGLVKEVAEHGGCEADPFLDVADEVLRQDLKNVWEWKRGRKISPDGKHRVRVWVHHELRAFQLKFEIRKSQVVVFEKVLLVEGAPDELVLNAVLGELSWPGDDMLVLSAKPGGGSPVEIALPGLH